MDIHKNLEAIMSVAEYYSKEHKCNYTVILHAGSTYEYVADSYFEKERSNCEIIHKFEYEENIEQKLEEEQYDSLIDGMYFESNKRFEESLEFDKILQETKYSHLSDKESNAVIVPVRNSNTNPKIGRNETCPCGSGKKYKNCCI